MNHTRPGFEESATSGTGPLPRFTSIRQAVETLKPVEPVYCIHPTVLKQVADTFVSGFPGNVLYAVKANPNPHVVLELYEAGIRHFDTASLREIQLIRSLCPEAECYFMAICKLVGAAETAFHDYGVRHFVADHVSEVTRLLKFADADTTIHIRMKAHDPSSVYELSSKFGAKEDEVIRLLRQVAEAGCKVGLAFNVGSLCREPQAYRRALRAACDIIRQADVTISSLDIGGGFPIAYPDFETSPPQAFFDAIKDEAKQAGLPDGCTLMCEPGRALVAEGQTLLTQVILVKDDLVFLNDGVYGNLKEMEMSDCVRFPQQVIRVGGEPSRDRRTFALSGPTCDSLDILPAEFDLPADIAIGDWIEFSLSGAYSNSMSTRFNGLYTEQWIRIEDGAAAA